MHFSGHGYTVIYPGDMITLPDSIVVAYDFDLVSERLKPYCSTENKIINDLTSVIRSHPDFFVTPSGIRERYKGRISSMGTIVAQVNGDKITISDQFEGGTRIVSYSIAVEYLQRLMLALNPTLTSQKQIMFMGENYEAAYPQMLVTPTKITRSGDYYQSAGASVEYTFEGYKRRHLRV
jgi:hypothetical protein